MCIHYPESTIINIGQQFRLSCVYIEMYLSVQTSLI